MHFKKQNTSMADKVRLFFSLLLVVYSLLMPSHALAAGTFEQTQVFLWLSAMPSWMPSVLLIASLMGLSWLGFTLLLHRTPSHGNKKAGYLAVAAAALVGMLFSPLVTTTWNNYLFEAINNLPPSAAGTVSVNLAWNASASSNVGGYIVSYGTNSGVYTQSIDVGNNTSTTLTGLQSGTAYYFAVSAYDTSRGLISKYSNETTFNAPPPPTVNFAAN